MPSRSRSLGYWILQVFFVLSIPVMLTGQTLSLFDYDLAVSMGMQESRAQVSDFGVRFNKAFGFGDTVVYVPMLLAAAVGLWRRSNWAPLIAAAALGVSAYWSITIAAAFFLLPGTAGYSYTPGPGVIAFVAIYAAFGIFGLVYILIKGKALTTASDKASN